MREIKFRAWDYRNESMWSPEYFKLRQDDNGYYIVAQYHGAIKEVDLMQYTGLKDKNGDNEIYECDIIDTDGNVIGNQYETPALLKEKTNLLIQGFGTKAWLTTYTQAVERGCHDA